MRIPTKRLWLSLSLLCALPACQRSHTPGAPSVDSNTNWLMACEVDAECGDRACLCGQCTQACDAQADCDGLPGARCNPPEEHDSCVATRQRAPVCLRECMDDDDCGERAACIRGACVPTRAAAGTRGDVSDGRDGGVIGELPRDGDAGASSTTTRDDTAVDADAAAAEATREDDCFVGCAAGAEDDATCERICAADARPVDTTDTTETDRRTEYCLAGCRERGHTATECERMCAQAMTDTADMTDMTDAPPPSDGRPAADAADTASPQARPAQP